MCELICDVITCCTVWSAVPNEAVFSVIESRGLRCHLYADDTQIYGYCRPHATLELMETVSVHRWHPVMDARQPAPVESSEDRDSLVCYRSTSSSAAAVTATRLLKPIVLPTAAVRDLGVFIEAAIRVKSTHLIKSRLKTRQKNSIEIKDTFT